MPGALARERREEAPSSKKPGRAGRGRCARPGSGSIGPVAGCRSAVAGDAPSAVGTSASTAIEPKMRWSTKFSPELAVLGMLEVRAGCAVSRSSSIARRAQQHLPAHAEVHDERVGRAVEREPQELAAAHGREHPSPVERGRRRRLGRRVAACSERGVERPRRRRSTAPVTAGSRPARTTSTSGSSGTSATREQARGRRRAASRPRGPRPSRPASCSCPRRSP